MDLASCYLEKRLSNFDDDEQINPREFAQLLNLVAYDVYYNLTFGVGDPSPESRLGRYLSYGPGYLTGRASFDTPFFNGPYPADQKVCFGDECYDRVEVNYVAQGMWAASSGDSLEDTLETSIFWNNNQYGHDPTDGELYWTQFGYEWYLNWLNNR
jgi:hypothetical protein